MDRTRPRRRGQNGPLLINLITFFVLLLTLASSAIIAFFFFQPHSPLNPYPPPTLPVVAVLPTQSTLPTAAIAVATVTPLFSETPNPTPTAAFTITPTPQASEPPATLTPSVSPTRTEPPASLTPGAEPSPTRVIVTGNFEFVVQEGSPLALANFANDEGCSWLGLAGTVFDGGNGVDGYVIHFEGGGQSLTATSGSAPAYSQAGGYELVLNDHVVATQAEYSVQLYNNSGQPLSVRLFFDTFADCERNLILINFERAS